MLLHRQGTECGRHIWQQSCKVSHKGWGLGMYGTWPLLASHAHQLLLLLVGFFQLSSIYGRLRTLYALQNALVLRVDAPQLLQPSRRYVLFPQLRSACAAFGAFQHHLGCDFPKCTLWRAKVNRMKPVQHAVVFLLYDAIAILTLLVTLDILTQELPLVDFLLRPSSLDVATRCFYFPAMLELPFLCKEVLHIGIANCGMPPYGASGSHSRQPCVLMA
mmetsp:Transcript_16040/g.36789  ORF Transcript_16040/g.36789 Transcript_16040/m.36789 type:complete len:218 (+) Transcript_16040:498-1151(+)